MSATLAGSRFTPDSFAPIAVADRNGADESLHHGVGVVTGPSGEIVRSVGDPDLPVYPRSSLKPFQTSAMLRLGLDLPHRLLAVVIASHSGEAAHLAAVGEILDRFDLSVDDLENTPARPLDEVQCERSIAEGRPSTRLEQNCSGKHAGMLATCRINGWETRGYLELDHPLQQAIVAETDLLAGRPGGSVVDVGIDGCGAPTHLMPIVDVARAMRTLQVESSDVVEAMAAHPFLVGGSDRVDSVWMGVVPGLAAKEGAAGVTVLGLPDGRAAAVKIADGSDDARRVVTSEVLRMLDVDVDGTFAGVRDRLERPVLGHGEPVGRFRSLPW